MWHGVKRVICVAGKSSSLVVNFHYHFIDEKTVLQTLKSHRDGTYNPALGQPAVLSRYFITDKAPSHPWSPLLLRRNFLKHARHYKGKETSKNLTVSDTRWFLWRVKRNIWVCTGCPPLRPLPPGLGGHRLRHDSEATVAECVTRSLCPRPPRAALPHCPGRVFPGSDLDPFSTRRNPTFCCFCSFAAAPTQILTS